MKRRPIGEDREVSSCVSGWMWICGEPGALPADGRAEHEAQPPAWPMLTGVTGGGASASAPTISTR